LRWVAEFYKFGGVRYDGRNFSGGFSAASKIRRIQIFGGG